MKNKISIFYDHIVSMAEQKNISIKEAAKTVRTMGVEYVDLNSRFLLSDYSQTMNILDDSGLKIGCICHECNLNKEGDYDKEYQIIDISNDLEVKEVLILPGLLSDDIKDNQIHKMIQGINILCKYAQDKNVTVEIETFDNSMSPLSGEGVILFLEQCESLKCVFDTGNFAFWDEDEMEYIQKLKNKVHHVHLKDRSMLQNKNEAPTISVSGRKLYPCAVGSGSIHIQEIIDVLKTIGYEGIYSIEHYGAEDMYEYIEKSVTWLKSI
ncbi:MAG: sugar phosphate isomerase/epimerase [Eubacterium sp.]|nr:sugar phosphate isomerase/epimerase [Eubacterium sp.]